MSNKNQIRGTGIGRRWSIGAVTFATIIFLTELGLMLSPPSFNIANHLVYVGNGVAVAAILTGALFWALAELFTDVGHSIWDLIARFGISMIVGFFVGGFMGYISNFGSFVLVPFKAGNFFAYAFVFAVLFVFVVIAYSAAYAHTRWFLKRYEGRHPAGA